MRATPPTAIPAMPPAERDDPVDLDAAELAAPDPASESLWVREVLSSNCLTALWRTVYTRQEAICLFKSSERALVFSCSMQVFNLET